MAALTTQEVTQAGTTLAFAACVTIATPGLYRGATITAQAVSVGAGSEKCIKPFPQEITQPGAATTNITYSGVTSLTIAVVKFTPPA